MPHIELDLPFDIDQRVYPILQNRSNEQREITCRFCEGAKDIEGRDGSKASCPRCGRRGTEVIDNPLLWVMDGLGEEGVLSIDHYKLDRADGGDLMLEAIIRQESDDEYWSDEWTVVADIFATPEAAQAECDKRNGVH